MKSLELAVSPDVYGVLVYFLIHRTILSFAISSHNSITNKKQKPGSNSRNGILYSEKLGPSVSFTMTPLKPVLNEYSQTYRLLVEAMTLQKTPPGWPHTSLRGPITKPLAAIISDHALMEHKLCVSIRNDVTDETVTYCTWYKSFECRSETFVIFPSRESSALITNVSRKLFPVLIIFH